MHIIEDSGREHHYVITFVFKKLNKEAEYEALVAVLEILKAMGVEVKAIHHWSSTKY